jgi:hypothetical protein
VSAVEPWAAYCGGIWWRPLPPQTGGTFGRCACSRILWWQCVALDLLPRYTYSALTVLNPRQFVPS